MYLKVLKAPPLAETYVKDGTLFSVWSHSDVR